MTYNDLLLAAAPLASVSSVYLVSSIPDLVVVAVFVDLLPG